jgi:hypothetical protein
MVRKWTGGGMAATNVLTLLRARIIEPEPVEIIEWSPGSEVLTVLLSEQLLEFRDVALDVALCLAETADVGPAFER